jgi:peptide/nickel transport system permease protein
MLAFIVRRIVTSIPVMALVALFVFPLLYIAPGGPAAIIAGDQASPAGVLRVRKILSFVRLNCPSRNGRTFECWT